MCMHIIYTDIHTYVYKRTSKSLCKMLLNVNMFWCKHFLTSTHCFYVIPVFCELLEDALRT